MRKIMLVMLMALAAACSKPEASKPIHPSPAAGKSDSDSVSDQEKKFFIARHEVEHGSPKRWNGFRAIMDLAVAGFEPAKDYYLAVRDTKPVLPGVSVATFGTYAEAVKVILPLMTQKIREEESKSCSTGQTFAILATQHGAASDQERWLFDYCEEQVLVPVRLGLNQETGKVDATVLSDSVRIQ